MSQQPASKAEEFDTQFIRREPEARYTEEEIVRICDAATNQQTMVQFDNRQVFASKRTLVAIIEQLRFKEIAQLRAELADAKRECDEWLESSRGYAGDLDALRADIERKRARIAALSPSYRSRDSSMEHLRKSDVLAILDDKETPHA